MSEQEKKQQKIYDLLNSKPKPKYFRNNWMIFMASIKLRPYSPLITLYGAFLK